MYGGCLLCPLYPLLPKSKMHQNVPYNSDRTDSNFNFIFSLFASNIFKENALKSVSNRKCNTYDIGVDGRKRSKCIKLNRWKNDDQKYHRLVSCSMRMYSVQLRSQRAILLVFERSGVDSRKRIKAVAWSRIDRWWQQKRIPLKLISVDRALVHQI